MTGFIKSMKERSLKHELMDDFGSDKEKLFNTLKQFKTVNILLSNYKFLYKKYILSKMTDRSKTYTLLDLGSGGCDIPVWISKYCKNKNINIKITCIDLDERAISFAKSVTKNQENIEIVKCDVYDIEKLGEFDFITANNFLHHFDSENVIKILKLIKDQAKNCFLINDLKRSFFSYIGFSILSIIFFRNSFTFTDGRISVQKGFMSSDFDDNKEFLEKNKIKIKKAIPGRIVFFN